METHAHARFQQQNSNETQSHTGHRLLQFRVPLLAHRSHARCSPANPHIRWRTKFPDRTSHGDSSCSPGWPGLIRFPPTPHATVGGGNGQGSGGKARDPIPFCGKMTTEHDRRDGIDEQFSVSSLPVGHRGSQSNRPTGRSKRGPRGFRCHGLAVRIRGGKPPSHGFGQTSNAGEVGDRERFVSDRNSGTALPRFAIQAEGAPVGKAAVQRRCSPFIRLLGTAYARS